MDQIIYLAPATNLDEQKLVDDARKSLEAAGFAVVIGKRPKRKPTTQNA